MQGTPMPKTLLILLSLQLAACQLFQPPMSEEDAVIEHIPDDVNLAQLHHLMKANRERMKPGKLSHKPVISQLFPGEQADIEIELDAGKPYTFFANCTKDCHDLDLALTRSDNLSQPLAADTSGGSKAPVLHYTPTVSGKYRASVIMASCTAAQCYYSLQTFTSSADSTPPR